MPDNEYTLADFRHDLAATLQETLVDYREAAESISRNQPPDDLPEFQREFLDLAVALTRLSRGSQELQPDPGEKNVAEGLSDLDAMRPLLQALIESYLLIGMASSWDQLRDEPLVTAKFISDHMTSRVRDLLAAAAATE